MKDIIPIYTNKFGIAFQWKRSDIKQFGKIQVVFRDTGLLLSKEELVQFAEHIKCAKNGRGFCENCSQQEDCRGLLLDTPAPQVTMAVSLNELDAIQDLVEGTLFHMNLDNYLDGICSNN